jgi:tRNA(Met) C34 N-acetyltransferase TmcA
MAYDQGICKKPIVKINFTKSFFFPSKAKSSSGARILKEVTLTDPIRYSPNDPMEAWLNDLLLLNVSGNNNKLFFLN